MQAAEKKLIIEKGSDFKIELEIVEGIGIAKDISNFYTAMYIQYYDETLDEIQNLDNTGSLIGIKYAFPGVLVGTPGNEGVNGEFNVIIDKAITTLFDTKLDMTKMTTRFGTEYNYFYHIEINEIGTSSTSENLRVLRGKMAIRN